MKFIRKPLIKSNNILHFQLISKEISWKIIRMEQNQMSPPNIYLQMSWNICSALTPAIIVPVPRMTKRNIKYIWIITWKKDSPWLWSEWNLAAKKSRSLLIRVTSLISSFAGTKETLVFESECNTDKAVLT